MPLCRVWEGRWCGSGSRASCVCRSSRAIVPGASAASPDSAGCARFRRNCFLKAAKPARNGSRLINGAWSIAAGSEFLRHDGSISISLRRHRRAGSCVPEGPFCCGASLGPHPGRWLDAAVDKLIGLHRGRPRIYRLPSKRLPASFSPSNKHSHRIRRRQSKPSHRSRRRPNDYPTKLQR